MELRADHFEASEPALAGDARPEVAGQLLYAAVAGGGAEVTRGRQ